MFLLLGIRLTHLRSSSQTPRRLSATSRAPVQATKIVVRKVKKDSTKSIVLSGKASKAAEEQSKRIVQLVREALTGNQSQTIVTDGSTLELSDPHLAENPTTVVLLLEGKFLPVKPSERGSGDMIYASLDKTAAEKIALEIGADMLAGAETATAELDDAVPAKLGGVETVLQQIREYVRVRLGCRLLRKQLRAPGLGGLLLYGAHGAGKTAVLESLFYETSRSKDILACESRCLRCVVFCFLVSDPPNPDRLQACRVRHVC